MAAWLGRRGRRAKRARPRPATGRAHQPRDNAWTSPTRSPTPPSRTGGPMAVPTRCRAAARRCGAWASPTVRGASWNCRRSATRCSASGWVPSWSGGRRRLGRMTPFCPRAACRQAI